MKQLITIILVITALTTQAQKEITPTDDFTVTGQVKKELKFTLADLEKFSARNIPDVDITNHLGEPRGTAKNLSGIPIKEILKDIEFKEESPKLLSEFYLTFIAADNYKVVYSWNEIFNSPTGDNIFLITSRDGKELRDMDQRILIITPTDFKTGRRHIKGLSKIMVGRAE
jgi:hypothetical protein